MHSRKDTDSGGFWLVKVSRRLTRIPQFDSSRLVGICGAVHRINISLHQLMHLTFHLQFHASISVYLYKVSARAVTSGPLAGSAILLRVGSHNKQRQCPWPKRLFIHTSAWLQSSRCLSLSLHIWSFKWCKRWWCCQFDEILTAEIVVPFFCSPVRLY